MQFELSFDQSEIARETDPPTSHEAAAGILPKLSTRQAEFMRCLKLLGCPSTAQEIAAMAPERDRESIRKRARECVELGHVVILGTKWCRITSKKATVYWIA